MHEDLNTELLNSTLIASLASINADGSIHLVPMWFLWDAEAILMPTGGGTRKARNLRERPTAAVMLHDSPGGLDVRGTTLTGVVEIVPAPESRELNRLIHLKYVTEDGLRIPSVREALAVDDVTLRFAPETRKTWDEVATQAAAELRESGAFVRTGLSATT